MYDCENTECDVKKLMDVAASEAVRKQAKIQQTNGENGIYAGQLAALRREVRITMRKMAELIGCNISEYSAFEHERKPFPPNIYQACMKYLKDRE